MFMAVSREIPRFLHDSLWDRGFPSILTSGTLKAGNGFVRTRQMTGLEKKSRVRECVAESPFCYRENCLLYIPENLKATLKEAGKRSSNLQARSVIWCVLLLGIHWYCLHLIP